MFVSAFLVDGEKTTLIDTGWPDTVDELLAGLDDHEATVDRVILTHDGVDHTGGLDRIVDRYDPELLVPAAETELIDGIDQTPTDTFEHGDVLAGGIEVIEVPGHTQAPTSLYFPERKLLIAGDVLDGSDRRGLPAGFLLPPPASYNEDHAAAELNLERLLEYDIETVLVFHGSHVMSNANEKLARLLDFEKYFQRGAKIVHAADPSGDDPEYDCR
jgi:glyoxylase-like metal-dependent hydrolase (beta-lactamase superfamily II)